MPSSLRSIIEEKPTTSAARIAARRRVVISRTPCLFNWRGCFAHKALNGNRTATWKVRICVVLYVGNEHSGGVTRVGSQHRRRRDWKLVVASVTRRRMSLVLQFFHSRTVARPRACISLVSRGLRDARYVPHRPPSGIPKQRRCVGEDPAQEGPMGPRLGPLPPPLECFDLRPRAARASKSRPTMSAGVDG